MRSPLIPETAIYTAAPSFRWDEYDPYSVLRDRDPATDQALATLTCRAHIAYALGCSEWVVFTLLPLIDDVRPLQLLEALWAFQMSDLYALPNELMEAEWQGPIRGPIDLSLVTVRNAVIGTEEGTSLVDASFAELIPLHVLRDPGPFHAWRAHALGALARLARDASEQRGQPIPREVLMDDRDAHAPIDWTDCVDRFLGGVDPARNPFLVPIGS